HVPVAAILVPQPQGGRRPFLGAGEDLRAATARQAGSPSPNPCGRIAFELGAPRAWARLLSLTQPRLAFLVLLLLGLATTEGGSFVVVGRTLEPGDKPFGLVIFEADNSEQAKKFAESDPWSSAAS
ncbi:MAG: uncharacterized protein QG602_847, partial [Verrucomicrobiota bacterium]|nr:uncharacterized protein [Verrucomicrobiota bacterium]